MTQIRVHKDQYLECDDVNREERVRKYLLRILLRAPKPIDICWEKEGRDHQVRFIPSVYGRR